MSRRTLASIAAVGAALVLAGCATGTMGSQSPSPSATGPQQVAVDAAWLDGGAVVAVLLEGSSTCLPMTDDVSYADGTLHVSLLEPTDTACTRDLVLRGVPVSLPAGVDPAEDLRVDVSGDGYVGSVQLAGVTGLAVDPAAEEGAPSAGWTTVPDTFALLTYGSSSCRPVLQDAAVTAPGEIAVAFVTPPADQVCTADYAPRVSVVPVSAVDPSAAYTAIVSGDAFDAIRVPIAGTPAS